MTSRTDIKPLLRIFLVFVGLTGVLSISAEDLQEGKTPTLRFVYAEACPHMCPLGENKVFTTDIARAIYSALGYRVEFINLPWARAAANAMSGELNGVLSTGSEEVPSLLFPRRRNRYAK